MLKEGTQIEGEGTRGCHSGMVTGARQQSGAMLGLQMWFVRTGSGYVPVVGRITGSQRKGV